MWKKKKNEEQEVDGKVRERNANLKGTEKILRKLQA
jgi:hypothetical protein